MIPFSLHPQIEADSVFLRDLPLSQLRLQNQSAVPWLLLVPRREAGEIFELTPLDRAQLMEEIALASRVLTIEFVPDKINVAALGNYVPQLHVHIIGRFKNDTVWPQPVWGKLPAKPYEVSALNALRQQLNNDKLWV